MKLILSFLSVLFVGCQTPKVTEEVMFGSTSSRVPTLGKENREPEFGIVILDDTTDLNSVEQFCKSNKCSIGLSLGKSVKGTKFKLYTLTDQPSGFYSLDGQWIDIYAVDTKDLALPGKGRKQRDWLRQSLSQSKAKWKIVFGADSVYPQAKGKKFSLGHYLKPMLEETKVDFFISGHESNKEFAEHGGTKFIVNGRNRETKETALQQTTSPKFSYLLLSKSRAVFRFVNSKGDLTMQRVFEK